MHFIIISICHECVVTDECEDKTRALREKSNDDGNFKIKNRAKIPAARGVLRAAAASSTQWYVSKRFYFNWDSYFSD